MRYPGFIAGAYTNQSLVEQGERLVNLYPERYEQSGSAPNQEGLFFTAVPGYSTFATLPTSPVLRPRRCAFATRWWVRVPPWSWPTAATPWGS